MRLKHIVYFAALHLVAGANSGDSGTDPQDSPHGQCITHQDPQNEAEQKIWVSADAKQVCAETYEKNSDYHMLYRKAVYDSRGIDKIPSGVVSPSLEEEAEKILFNNQQQARLTYPDAKDSVESDEASASSTATVQALSDEN